MLFIELSLKSLEEIRIVESEVLEKNEFQTEILEQTESRVWYFSGSYFLISQRAESIFLYKPAESLSTII